MINYSRTPGGDTSFEGKAAKTARITEVIKVNGAPKTTTTQTIFFQVTPFKILGYTTDSGAYTIASNQMPLPASGKVGDAGGFYTATQYTSSSAATVISNIVAAWSIEFDTSDTASFCRRELATSVSSQQKENVECYKMSTAGQITGMRVAREVDGKMITFTG